MRSLCRLVLVLLALPAAVQAQTIRVEGTDERVAEVLLREELTAVPGMGLEVPGFDLADRSQPRHAFGGDTTLAARALIDTSWVRLSASQDSIVPNTTVHWVRYHALPDAALRGVPLLLRVGASRPFDIYLNGRRLLRSSALPIAHGWPGLPSTDSLQQVTIPFQFACDGATEVIAVRVICAPGEALGRAGLHGSLHMGDLHYAEQRRMVHFGVFIGINLMILLLALVIWVFERQERNWLLLALLSLATVLDTFCDVAHRSAALGFGDAALKVLGLLQAVLVPWPMYLLILVLARLSGYLTPKRARRYAVMVALLTVVCIVFGVAELLGVLERSKGFQIVDGSGVMVAALIVLLLLFALVIAWFAVVSVRLGIRVLRTSGYERWIGGGALVSSLLALLLRIVGAATGTGFGEWLSMIGDYCYYVAVPVSIAIYLAIRSAHHNRLVARQRDDLDAEVKERTAQLSAEKERSDALLLNILPAEVAEELKRTGAAEARHFDQATVMFTDFKGFTTLTEQVGPAELLQELNNCFKAFDDIIGRRGIEKIKTIGDAYMCAGGLPDPASASPTDVVHAALEMQAFMKARRAEHSVLGRPAFEMRVGIHSGPVVAGIVGVKKFQYDIWGDAVNTASRMESSGEVGEVNISEATYVLVKEAPGLRFTARGKVQAKGKGEMEMYFVGRA